MNNNWRIPGLVFSFPGIFSDGYRDFPSPNGLTDPWYGWIEFSRELLSDESIGVFIKPPFPWGIRMNKEKLRIQIFSNGFMLDKFFPLSEVTVYTLSLLESSKLMIVRSSYWADLLANRAIRHNRDLRSNRESKTPWWWAPIVVSISRSPMR